MHLSIYPHPPPTVCTLVAGKANGMKRRGPTYSWQKNQLQNMAHGKPVLYHEIFKRCKQSDAGSILPSLIYFVTHKGPLPSQLTLHFIDRNRKSIRKSRFAWAPGKWQKCWIAIIPSENFLLNTLDTVGKGYRTDWKDIGRRWTVMEEYGNW